MLTQRCHPLYDPSLLLQELGELFPHLPTEKGLCSYPDQSPVNTPLPRTLPQQDRFPIPIHFS